MATALETASLVMVPSGYEDGTLGSLQPLDGTGDFTFTRGSNISATRVNEDGYIEKGYENLLLRSNTFDTTWASVRVSESTGFAGYDGADNAWKIVPNTQLGDHRLDQSTSVSGVWTFNIYAKAAGYNFLYILFSGIGNSGKVIDISPNQGVVVDNKGGVQAIDESITDVGNDWWKITLTYSGTLGTLRIITLPANDTSSYAGDGTSGILIQDAQVNQGLVAYPYLETTTTTAKGGILEDMPRLNYSSGRCSLLLEPSRTNLIVQSEYFGSGWQSNQTTITSNTHISPEGVLNASTIADTNTTDVEEIQYRFSPVAGASYALSLFIKKDEDTTRFPEFFFRNYNGGTEESIVVRLNTQTGEKYDRAIAGSPTSNVINFSDDYWRLIITLTESNTGNNQLRLYIRPAAASTIDGPNSNLATGSIVAYGLQLEQDATYPTSYIPTYGVSQTRLKDALVGTGAQSNGLLGTDSGTIFIDATHLATSNDTSSWSFVNASNTQQFRVGSGASFFFISDRVHSQGDLIIYETTYKAAIRYSPSGLEVFVNGVKDTSSFANGDYTIDRLNYSGIGGRKMDFNQLLYFPTTLSDEACIELTTI